MADVLPVHHGKWKDLDTGQWNLLADNYWATIWKGYIAICLSLSWPYIFRILLRVIYWLLFAFERLSRKDDLGSENERTPMLGNHIRDASSGRGLLRNVYSTRRSPFILLCAFGGFVAWAVAGIMSARVATDNVALLAADYCGIWGFDSDKAGDDAATRADIVDRGKEARAGDYTRSCYENSTIMNPISCNSFYRSKIPYDRNTTDPFTCPFNQSICITGVPWVTFDTGIRSARVLGINSDNPYKFRRLTKCGPLSRDYPFVQRKMSNDSETYTYHYGKLVDTEEDPPRIINYTYATSGDPFEQLAPMYNVRTYATSLYPEYDYWVPREELQPPENSTLTIMFISPLHIYYLRPSADPIFPADKEVFVEGDPYPWYRKSDAEARPLVCIDRTDICSPDGKECWSMTDERDGTKFPPDYWLMKLSLETSTIYDSLNHRLGSALQAQELVSQYRSPRLHDRHWMVEVERLWATSLARVQFNTLEIASAEGRGLEGYVEQTPEEAGDLCGILKIRSAGYANINLVLLCISGLPTLLLLALLASTISDVNGACQKVSRSTKRMIRYIWPRVRTSRSDPESSASEPVDNLPVANPIPVPNGGLATTSDTVDPGNQSSTETSSTIVPGNGSPTTTSDTVIPENGRLTTASDTIASEATPEEDPNDPGDSTTEHNSSEDEHGHVHEHSEDSETSLDHTQTRRDPAMEVSEDDMIVFEWLVQKTFIWLVVVPLAVLAVLAELAWDKVIVPLKSRYLR